MQVILYTIDCPKCLVLEKKLRDKGIEYQVCKDKDLMIQLRFNEMPMLRIVTLDDNGEWSGMTNLNFTQAVKWINEQ